MKKSISKTIVTIAIVTAFLMPLMGNTALADSPVTYYFDSRDRVEPIEEWTTSPGNMIDGSTSTFTSTQLDNDVQLLDDNTCPGNNLGTITTVEIRAKGYHSSEGEDSADIILRPVYPGGDGDNHIFDATITSSWSDWFVITTDTNAPNPWTWTDVANLNCDVEADGSGEFTLFCSKVEIQVTYR